VNRFRAETDGTIVVGAQVMAKIRAILFTSTCSLALAGCSTMGGGRTLGGVIGAVAGGALCAAVGGNTAQCLAAAVVSGADPIAFTDSLPICFRGDTDIPNISLKGVGKPVFDTRQAAILSDMYAGHPLQSKVIDGLELRQEVGRALEMEMKEASRDAISPKGFELEARRIGRLMRDQYRIGFVDVGGWDTHVNEGGAQGALANNVESLGRGLVAMSHELGGEWRNTVVAVVSEFGRTFRENGNKGTDHGHGSVHWLLGGSINGGRIAGEQARVDKTSLFQDRDYPVLNEYRAVLGGLFQSLWGLCADQVQHVFPQAMPIDLKLI